MDGWDTLVAWKLIRRDGLVDRVLDGSEKP